MTIADLLISLLAIFVAAKVFGELAERIGQSAVLGEMIGGIVIGVSGLHLIDAHDPLLHVLAELGVILLLCGRTCAIWRRSIACGCATAQRRGSCRATKTRSRSSARRSSRRTR